METLKPEKRDMAKTLIISFNCRINKNPDGHWFAVAEDIRAHPISKYSFFTHRTFAQLGQNVHFLFGQPANSYNGCALSLHRRASRHKQNKAAAVIRTQKHKHSELAKKSFLISFARTSSAVSHHPPGYFSLLYRWISVFTWSSTSQICYLAKGVIVADPKVGQ